MNWDIILLEFEEQEDLRRREKLCHAFAGAFLLPKNVILSELGGNRRSKIAVWELTTLKETMLCLQRFCERSEKFTLVFIP
jgi:Zn-dependent peptidase ImmA (M78 family)